ncbi:TetR family transcriptional regulator [Algoriphagus sp. NG3]|uniref:TetR family transcriptional regulator n=1 Tax=Algoriphagus sp. NG3 TaxID=3097546 RepID=UPI002A80792A|nr:TetR family transcriptional regulator [Algoriphagus sp. NG3]WPR77231.1 TetR family transcriptional regulator [Algoriphagus sp. NG3]
MALTSITEIRRQEILKAFYQTAQEEGLENTSLAKIAKILDVQPSLIVHYFKNKEELLSALIDYCLEKYSLIFEQEFSKPGEPRKKIKILIERLFSKDWNELFDDGVFYSCYALIFRSVEIREKFKILHEGLRSNLTSIIQQYLTEVGQDAQLAETISHQIFILVDGSYYFINMIPDKKEQEFHLNTAKKLAQTLLGLEK